jgi:glycosyltransferase involved in cell wall biosynthesis
MKLWIISQYYPPEPGAPSVRLSGLAHSWQQAGVDVTVLTGIPNHPDGIVPPAYAGRATPYTEAMAGIRVRRHRLFVAPNHGRWPRVWNQLSFAFSVLRSNLKRPADVPAPDVILASSPSFFCVISAWLLSVRHGAKFVFEVRDLWPAIFVQMGILKPGLLVWLLERVEMFLYHRAHLVVPVTRSFADDIAQRGISPHKIQVIFNGVADADYAQAMLPQERGETVTLRASLGLSPLTKVVLYIGNHGEAQALTQVIDAARLMVRRTDVVFLLVGQGAMKAKLQEYAKGVPNVQFLPPVKHSETWAYYGLADVNLVCLKDIPEFSMFIPSKMFEIMAAGRAAVAALRGEGANIMQASGCALVVGSEEVDAMAEAIQTLLDDPARRATMGAAGRTFVAQHFLHSALAQRYLQSLQALRSR